MHNRLAARREAQQSAKAKSKAKATAKAKSKGLAQGKRNFPFAARLAKAKVRRRRPAAVEVAAGPDSEQLALLMWQSRSPHMPPYQASRPANWLATRARRQLKLRQPRPNLDH